MQNICGAMFGLFLLIMAGSSTGSELRDCADIKREYCVCSYFEGDFFCKVWIVTTLVGFWTEVNDLVTQRKKMGEELSLEFKACMI